MLDRKDVHELLKLSSVETSAAYSGWISAEPLLISGCHALALARHTLVAPCAAIDRVCTGTLGWLDQVCTEESHAKKLDILPLAGLTLFA